MHTQHTCMHTQHTCTCAHSTHARAHTARMHVRAHTHTHTCGALCRAALWFMLVFNHVLQFLNQFAHFRLRPEQRTQERLSDTNHRVACTQTGPPHPCVLTKAVGAGNYACLPCISRTNSEMHSCICMCHTKVAHD